MRTLFLKPFRPLTHLPTSLSLPPFPLSALLKVAAAAKAGELGKEQDRVGGRLQAHSIKYLCTRGWEISLALC